MLPSRYIPVEMIGGLNCYFDTGVKPSNDMNVTALFYTSDSTTATYLFGSRNTNSTSSAGQFNLFQNASGTSYIGFAGARIGISEFYVSDMVYFANTLNQFTINSRNVGLTQKTGATTTFTGTRNMYILALNNAGSVAYGSDALLAMVRAFKIEQGGVVIHNYAPCYDTVNAEFGLYDLIDEVFLQKQGTGSLVQQHLLQVQGGTGGDAYIQTATVGNVKKQYRGSFANLDRSSPCIAVPQDGYDFLNWTDQNGNVVSTEETYYVSQSIVADTTLTANFIKKTLLETRSAYQLLGLEYGESYAQSAGDPNASQTHIYANVRSFKCLEDALSEATSTIELDEVPSLYQMNMPVFLISPKGKMIWSGIIQNISGNTLTCREPLSLYNSDILCSASTSIDGTNLTERSVLYGTWVYFLECFNRARNLQTAPVNPFLYRLLKTTVISWDQRLFFDRNKNMIANFPAMDAGTYNAEEEILNFFDQFGLTVKPTIIERTMPAFPEKGKKKQLQLTLYNPRSYEPLTIGNNTEVLSNVSVTVSGQETTSLIIYNSTGATLRGMYAVTTDGVIEEVDTSNPSKYIAYTVCKNKVITSDDKIVTLIEQELSNAQYNHQITFDIDLNYGLYRLEDFQLGRSVNFYYDDRLFRSVVTGKEYSSANNMNINSIKVTLGNVRTKLTIKLNKGKKK